MVTIFNGTDEAKELLNKTLELSGDGYLMEINLVPTTPYGSEGMMPVPGHCMEYPEGDISCVGSSGSNMCGGFMGSEGSVVFCQYTKRKTNEN